MAAAPRHRRSSSASAMGVASVAPVALPSASAAPTRTQTVRKRRNSLSAGAAPRLPLVGVVAMVDVRVGPEAQIDCSSVVADKMAELGASIVKRFTPRVTHIVLSHLTATWKDKIAKWTAHISVGLARRVDGRPEVQIVTQLWVNACYVSKTRMDEKPFFPVSKAVAAAVTGVDSGHLHLNGAMRQFVLNNPPPPPVVTPRSAFSSSARAGGASTTGPVVVSSNRTQQSIDSTDTTTAATNGRQGSNTSAAVTAPATGTTAGPPLSRHAKIQFQFGAAAALAAATLSSHAIKRKRRAASMEPLASDAIQKLLTPQREVRVCVCVWARVLDDRVC